MLKILIKGLVIKEQLTSGEFNMVQNSAILVAELPFGQGNIGRERRLSDEQLSEELETYVRPINVFNTADCVDGRTTLALADGTKDKTALIDRVTFQLPGGLVLPATKAAIAADLIIVRDAKTFKQAYLTMYDFLIEAGFKDGGHEGCGASKFVEASIVNSLDEGTITTTLGSLGKLPNSFKTLYSYNSASKQRKLNEGFYSDWDSTWHEDFLSQRVPENFSLLRAEDNDTSGHYEQGLFIVEKSGHGFAKNDFNQTTDTSVFCLTTQCINILVNKIGHTISASDSEQKRFNLEMVQDSLNVLNLLADKGLPVFVTD